MKNPTIEAGKELIRMVLLSVIPVVYLSLEQGSVDWKVITILAVVSALRAVEKWLHLEDSKFQLPV